MYLKHYKTYLKFFPHHQFLYQTWNPLFKIFQILPSCLAGQNKLPTEAFSSKHRAEHCIQESKYGLADITFHTNYTFLFIFNVKSLYYGKK